MKKAKKFLGIIAILAIIGFAVTACDDGGGGGSGDVTFDIINTTNKNIKSVSGQNGDNGNFTQNVTISAGDSKQVTFSLKKTKIGYPVTLFYVTFDDDSEVYSSSSGFVDKTKIIVTVTNSDITGLLD